jgi:hypothetical protein
VDLAQEVSANAEALTISTNAASIAVDVEILAGVEALQVSPQPANIEIETPGQVDANVVSLTLATHRANVDGARDEGSGGGNHYSFDYEPILSEREYKALADAYMRTGRDDHPDKIKSAKKSATKESVAEFAVEPPKTTTSARAITAGLTSAQQSVEALRREIEYAKTERAQAQQVERVEAERLQAQQRIEAEEAKKLRRKREDEAAILLLLAS